MKKSTVIVLALALLGGAAQAEDLDQVYTLALESDPQLRAARAARNSALETRPQAIAQLLPLISANGSTNRVHQDIKSGALTATGTNSFDRNDFSLNLSQPVFRYDRIVQLRQSDSVIAQAEAEYTAAEQDLILRTAEAYFGVLTAEDELEFRVSDKKAIARQLDQAQQRFEVGLIAITDVHEAQARYDLATADEIIARNELANSREQLREIIGVWLTDISRPSTELPLISPDPDDIEAWSKVAQDQNLNIIAAQEATNTARENINLQRAGHYPNLDVVGSHAFDESGAATFGSRSWTSSIGLQVSVPIYSGGGVVSRTRQAEDDLEQSLETLDQQRRSTDRQARDAFRTVGAAISAVKAFKQAVVSNESALEATEAGFEVGTRTIVEVLDSQRDLLQARRDYQQARYQYILNGLSLKQAAGSLSPDDIAQVNRWLQ